MPRGRTTHADRSTSASQAGALIPDKLYFRIGEVSELTETKPYVLRYWETEFPSLKPVKSPSGHRLYRRQDVETVLTIKRLLYELGYTIQGARQQLSSDHSGDAAEEKSPPRSPLGTAELKAIRRELQGVLTILSRKC